MLLSIENLPVSIEAEGAYHFFHLKHDWSMDALSSLVLNDVAVEQTVSRASTDFGFDLMTTEEYVRAVNKAIIDRNSLRHMVDTKVEFTDEEKETTEREFQRILLTQIHGYLKTAEQDLTDKGIRHTVSPGIGLVITN